MTLTENEAENVIRQICEGKKYYDGDSEYFEGESQSYFFFREDEKFYLQRMDVIAGAYNMMEEVSKEYLKEFLMTKSKYELNEQGFVL